MFDYQRINIDAVDPKARKAVLAMQRYVNSSGLDKGLVALLEIRASQLNHCAWCLDMHTREAAEIGVPIRKINLVAAWEEAPTVFTEREQAALGLTDEVTLLSEGGVSDGVWAEVSAYFSDEEVVALLMTISTINTWNRLNVAARTPLPHD